MLNCGDRYTLLEVDLHGKASSTVIPLATIGHPIKGDVKYGARRTERDKAFVYMPIARSLITRPLKSSAILKRVFLGF